MPSTRRRLLASAGFALAGAVGGSVAGAQSESPPEPLSWPMARYDAAGTASHSSATGPRGEVEVAWSHESTDWFRGTTSPISVGGRLYAAGGGLLALDPENGERAFGATGPYQSSPARAPAAIYETATLAVTTPTEVFGLNEGGGIGVPLTDERLGVERWREPGSKPGFFGPLEPPSPVVADETIYTPVPAGESLVALDSESGHVRWRVAFDDEETSSSFQRPAIRDGLVFATAWPGQVSAYRAESGVRGWHRNLDEQMISSPVATAEGVVVQTREDVRLLDPADGSRLWDTDLDANVTDSVPAVADGTVFVADELGSMRALDLASGEVLWTTPFDGKTAPVVADGVVYAVRSGFELVGLDAASGERLFTYRPSQVPLSAPIVGDGRLYAANRKRVIALEETA
ncbi:PQQ-like beta-propeller repeat protein [Halomicrobium sp. IBSBa]|uniref:PQQ-binding-like beta-propeller repeat protein n=1 Tax=Halomicrobium sp. IBSBa TaxID=2778916 RepID=UPI001ABF4558|nr:PQQ-binding-like beta-propeller repeat protein [Halomicrobium sp. IBSBa]MBO4249257.1 PQQ-like beta-propeller repeat protein [Halomicrobium sp. IBSBa]